MPDALLKNSTGKRPRVVQDDMYPEGIHSLVYASEARRLLVGTDSGFVILLHRDGLQEQRVRGFDSLNHLVWSEDGQFGASVTRSRRLTLFDRHFRPIWKVTMNSNVLAIAIAPFGSHVAIATEARRIHVVTADKKEIADIEVPRDFSHLQFCQSEARFVGAAEFGQVSSYAVDGDLVWEERNSNNVGSMAMTANGERVLLAAFNHGIQVLDEDANQLGTFQLQGLPTKLVCSMNQRRIAALTLEHSLYYLNFEGDMIWATVSADDPIQSMAMNHAGDRLFVSTASGRLIQLKW